MKISIETLESTNFGDHAERLRRSHVVVEGETVEDLVRRVFTKLERKYYTHDATDEIVIRVAVTETDPAGPDPFAPAPAGGGF